MSWPIGLGPCSPHVILARCMVATSCPRVVDPNCKHRVFALLLSLGPPRSLSVHLPHSCHERSSSRAEHRHCSLLPTPATLMQPLASPCPPLSRARAPSSLTHLYLCLASLSLALYRARSPWLSLSSMAAAASAASLRRCCCCYVTTAAPTSLLLLLRRCRCSSPRCRVSRPPRPVAGQAE
jgi:hypothetical protein